VASLVVVRSGGDVVAVCDALCYDARHSTCVCSACGGVNHGRGYDQAVLNTRRLHAEWLERARFEHPDVVFELGDVLQFPLFPLPQEQP
jgi:hypothetical protein